MTTTQTPEERNALRKKRISRAIKQRHRDPEWRRRWEIGNATGKHHAQLLREQAGNVSTRARRAKKAAARRAFWAQLTQDERRALGIE